jgi:hypothetical protein
VWCGVVWCGVVWCGVVWCGVVWCGVVWCGVVWCGVVWCGCSGVPHHSFRFTGLPSFSLPWFLNLCRYYHQDIEYDKDGLPVPKTYVVQSSLDKDKWYGIFAQYLPLHCGPFF